MRSPSRLLPNVRFSGRLAVQSVRRFKSATLLPNGRTAPYRRIGDSLLNNSITQLWLPSSRLFLQPISNTLSKKFISRAFSTTPRPYAISFRDLKSDEKGKAPLRPGADKTSKKNTSSAEEEDPAEKAYREAQRESQANFKRQKEEQKKEESSAGGKEGADGAGEQQKRQKDEPPPPPPHGNKSPWQVFTDTLKTEFKASKEWNESTKQLASSAHQFTENESVKRARAAYTAASGAATSGTATALKGAGKAVGQGAAWTWDSTPVRVVRSGVSATGRGIEAATRPVRETKVFKTAVGGVKNVIDDGSSSKYGGWVEKEERRRQRELREMNEAAASGIPGRRIEKMEENPNAGTNVTLHKDSKLRESWKNFKDSSRVMQSIFSLKSSYNESENPLISTARSVTDRIAGFFAENETAMVIKAFREMDPSFQVEPFLREMREYILPEVLDAYVKGDTETLKLWLSAAQYQVYAALTQQYTTAGLKSDGRILDIRHVDILSARMLENEVPVFVITCRTQEVHVYRKAKTNELAAGMEDKVQLVTYAIGITRLAEDVNNPDTRGWRLIELQKSARDYI
ncbi:hypothetical protein N7G274_003935 [Stereocaulon virgatum]|uniref:Tim44-like domain-containing protein n=1 Tax=Stereocaulon virgatum TaxID=373712 RepID=A0ABR4AJQ2_9LECA